MKHLSKFIVTLLASIALSANVSVADPLEVAAKWTAIQGGVKSDNTSDRVSQGTSFKKGGVMAAKLTVKGTHDLTIELTNFAGVGEYELTDGSQGKASITVRGKAYSTTELSTGTMTVEKYDAATNTVSGSFTFKAQDLNGNEITVMDGEIE